MEKIKIKRKTAPLSPAPCKLTKEEKKQKILILLKEGVVRDEIKRRLHCGADLIGEVRKTNNITGKNYRKDEVIIQKDLDVSEITLEDNSIVIIKEEIEEYHHKMQIFSNKKKFNYKSKNIEHLYHKLLKKIRGTKELYGIFNKNISGEVERETKKKLCIKILKEAGIEFEVKVLNEDSFEKDKLAAFRTVKEGTKNIYEISSIKGVNKELKNLFKEYEEINSKLHNQIEINKENDVKVINLTKKDAGKKDIINFFDYWASNNSKSIEDSIHDVTLIKEKVDFSHKKSEVVERILRNLKEQHKGNFTIVYGSCKKYEHRIYISIHLFGLHILTAHIPLKGTKSIVKYLEKMDESSLINNVWNKEVYNIFYKK